MTLATNRLTIEVSIEDDYGNPLYTVPVELTYAIERECYGADADGNRGVIMEVYHVLDTAIEDLEILKQLTSAQVEYAIDRAYRLLTAIEKGGYRC